MFQIQSDFRTAPFVCECDALRSAAGETLDHDSAGSDTYDFRVTQAGFAGGGAGFAFAATAHAGRATTVHVSVAIADDRADAVGAYPQLHVLRACRDWRGDGYQGDAERQTRSFY
jgi:hypothetical protein